MKYEIQYYDISQTWVSVTDDYAQGLIWYLGKDPEKVIADLEESPGRIVELGKSTRIRCTNETIQ